MNSQSDSQNKPSLGVIGLLITLLLALPIGFALADVHKVRYGVGGAILWGSVLLISFLLGWVYFARFLLPVKGGEGWAEGLQVLGRNYLLQSKFYIEALLDSEKRKPERVRRVTRSQQKAAEAGETAVTPPVKEPLPPSFKQLRAGFVPSYQAVAISKGNTFVRAAGPGFVNLYKKENVTHVLDLRPHLRLQTVNANTKDGIPVTTTAIVVFRIRQRPLASAEEKLLLYPYDSEAIFQASYTVRVDSQNQSWQWHDVVAPKAASLLAAQLTQYSLDDLYQNSGRLSACYDEVKRELAKWVKDFGIEILTVSSTLLQPPDDVQAQRLKNWQAKWQRQIYIQKAASQAEAERRIKRARARAQVEIIANITQNIAAMRLNNDANLTEIITLRMIEALEEATSHDAVRTLIPQQIMGQLVMDTSSQMRRWLKEPPETTP